MPKQPETSDRYRIWCEVPLERVGYVLKGLTQLGVEHVGHELITDIATYKQRKPREVAAEAAPPPRKSRAKKANGKEIKHRRKRGQSPQYVVSNKDFIFRRIKGREEITSADLTKMFKDDGRNPKSAGSLLTQFSHAGYLKSMGGGVWKILPKALNVAMAARAEKPNV